MYTNYIIALCAIIIIIIIIAIYTSNVIVIPFGICIFGLLGASIYFSSQKLEINSDQLTRTSPSYIYGARERTKQLSRAKSSIFTQPILLDNWYKLSRILYYQSYPHIVTKMYSLLKNLRIHIYIDIEPYTVFGHNWILRELSNPPIINKISSVTQFRSILQIYTDKYPRSDAVVYQEITNIAELIPITYTITVHPHQTGSNKYPDILYTISSMISSNTLIPDEVIDLFKYIAVIIDTCVYIPSILHKDIIKQYNISIVRPAINTVQTDKYIENSVSHTENIHNNSDWVDMYNKYLIVDWAPLASTNKMKFNIPISTIQTSSKSITYIFDMIRYNQRDFLKYTTENKWRRIDINIATIIDINYIVDLHFYSNDRSRIGTAISKMPARVKSSLSNFSNLANKIELHKSILANPKLVKYIPESIIILHQKIDPNNKNVDIVPTSTEPWIWRPEYASLGWGVEIVTSKSELDAVIDKYEYLDKKYRFVLSRYITNPKLIKNINNGLLYKFHIRLHLVISIDKYYTKRFFLVNTGEILVSSIPYINKDYNNIKIHDTHFDKFSNSFFPDDFPGTEPEKDKITKDVRTMVRDICNTNITREIKKTDKCESGFHIFGIDIMITDENNPVLIEINRYPGFPNYTDLQYPNDVTRLSHEFYSGLWDMVINPLVTGAPIVENHEYITLLTTIKS